MDIDALLKREIPFWALVNGQGVSVGGTSTLSLLSRRGMEAICQVDASGTALDASTLRQLQVRGIQYFCEVTELGVDPVSSATLTQLGSRGIPAKCPVTALGIAQSGSATIETLRKRGIAYFCPLDETGTATTLGTINLSAATFSAGAAQGTAIGTLSVVGGSGTYTFTLTDSHTNAVQVAGTNGVNLQVGSSSSGAGSFNITVHADNGAGSTFDRVFLITAIGANTGQPMGLLLALTYP